MRTYRTRARPDYPGKVSRSTTDKPGAIDVWLHLPDHTYKIAREQVAPDGRTLIVTVYGPGEA